MRIIKRNGAEVGFDITKIIIAVTKANESVEEVDRMTPVQIQRIAESVELQCQKMNRAPTVEEIQDMVEHYIMAHGAFEVAKHYITYRYTRSLVRKSNTTDDKILSLIECNNEEAKQENSNKNPVVNSTQRDYMAGEVSRDITNRILLPQDIVAVGLFNQGAGDDGAVLQHVLQIHQIAVVHVLGKVVGIVEVDQTILMCLYDLRVQQQTGGQIFGDLTGHIVTLHTVDGGVLVGVLLLDLFVLALDQAQNALIGGVGLTLQTLDIAVGDIVTGNVVGFDVHELVLHHILHLLHA